MAKVMLVEDDNNLREIYEARLQAEGYTIVSAQDGEAALVIAKQEKPDLIISDVMMPKISGFEMLDILRNTDGLKDVKIIMLTALGQAEDKTRADSLGANKYLVKSQVTLEDIVKTAHQLLDDAAAPAAPVAPASPTTTTPAEPVAVQPEPAAVQAIPVASAPSEQTTPATTPAAPADDTPTGGSATPVTPASDAPVPPAAPAATPAATVTPTTGSTPPAVAADTDAADSAGESTAQEEAAMRAQIDSFVRQPANTPEPTAPTPTDALSGEGTQSAEPAKPSAAPEPAAPSEAPAPSAPVVEPAAPAAPAAPEPAAAPPTITVADQNAADDQQLVTSAVDSLVADTNGGVQRPSEVTAVEVPAPAAASSEAPAPAPAAPAADTGGDNVAIAHKKVIQPLNDPSSKTDLNALLAKETANEPAPAAPTASVINPTDPSAAADPGQYIAPTPKTDTPGPAPGPDPNNIAL